MNAVPSKSVIEEAALELGITPAFVEKDWYVVQMIDIITKMDLFGAQAIFTAARRYPKHTDFLAGFPRISIFGWSCRLMHRRQEANAAYCFRAFGNASGKS